MNAKSDMRSDFLATIVDRAQERAPVIAPRPTSLFEPFAAPHVANVEAEAAAEQASFAHSHEPRANGDNTATARTPPHRADTDAMSRVRHASERFDDSSATAEPLRARPPANLASEDEHESSTMHERVPHATSESAPPRVANAPISKMIASPSASAAPIRSAAERDSDDVVSPRQAQTDASPMPAIAAQTLATLLPNRELAMAAAPAGITGRGAAEPAAQAAAAPAVTISIGRVEVRAAAPAAPKMAPAKSARRPMRLDEYLARKERTR